jgi:hypothetical protein
LGKHEGSPQEYVLNGQFSDVYPENNSEHLQLWLSFQKNLTEVKIQRELVLNSLLSLPLLGQNLAAGTLNINYANITTKSQ